MGAQAGTQLSARRAVCSLLACIAILAGTPATSHAEAGAQAVAWGTNARAELGAGWKDAQEESPVQVAGLGDITAVAAGTNFNLMLLADGTVRASGGNMWGQLGDGSHAGSWEEMKATIPVDGLTDVTAVAAANAHALALLANGTVMAWGNNNYGQLGDGKGGMEKLTGENGTVPKQVQGLANVIAIASGGGSNYALLSNHQLMAWGQNGSGQLGIGEVGPETCTNELGVQILCSTIPRPVVVAGLNAKHETELKPLSGVASIAAGEQAAYAVLEDGHVMAWGANDLGQLGTGAEPSHANPVPQEVDDAETGLPLSGIASVSGGAFDALALSRTGEVLGWGAAGSDQLGSVRWPEWCRKLLCLKAARPLAGLEKVKATSISAGEGYGLAVSGGRVFAFGKDEHGQLGNGTTGGGSPPAVIGGLGPVAAVAAGSTQAIAMLAPGVAPPPPLLSLEARVASLVLAWSFHDEQYDVQYRPLGRSEPQDCRGAGAGAEAEACQARSELSRWLGTKLGERAHTIELARLGAEPYLVVIKSIDAHRFVKRRMLIGTPLP
jgi:hypothetical protein